MILLIGSPCSGKTSIGRRLSRITGLSLVTLDEFIEKQVLTYAIAPGTTLNDEFIEEAVASFANSLSTSIVNSINELPYHDYEQLFKDYPILSSNLIVALYCPFATLLERNQARLSNRRIPVAYMQRCFNSLDYVIAKNLATHHYNTETETEEEITNAIAGIF